MTETAEKYQTELAPLDIAEITDANLKAMKSEILAIPAVPESKDEYLIAKTINISAKKIRPRIEERRKEIKAPHLAACREIDALAKKTMGMIQPIIDMSAERREAWEAKIEAEKEAERAAERERLEKINDALKGLTSIVDACMEYGLNSGQVKAKIEVLKDVEISEDVFQEHTESATNIKETGLAAAGAALEIRIKFETEQAEFEAKKKAQEEAQAKLKAEREAEAARLAKIEAEQKAQAEKIKAEQAAAAKKLADEKAAFEAEKKAMADAEAARIAAEEKRKAEELEIERLALRDRLWNEALPIHIWEHVYPVALAANAEFDQKRKAEMDAAERRADDISRDRKVIDAMGKSIENILNDRIKDLSMPEFKELTELFCGEVRTAIFSINSAAWEVK